MPQYPNIKIVRIEIEPGQADAAKRWIAQAQGYGYQVIATYHKWQASSVHQQRPLF